MKLISFCINTARNELNHVKLLFKSLEQNLSTKQHEILIFIDSDNQGTFEWLLTQKDVFPNLKILQNHLPIPYGYQRNINELFKQASHPIVSYLQSDMVVCKNYDLELLQKIEPNMILCSTRIEPPLHGNSGEKITFDFGLDPIGFNLEAFTQYAESQKSDMLTEYFFAPFTLYKDVWLSIGGHDTQFRRSREDSDVLTRLVLNGTKIVQTWRALVYHFTCTSSRGPKWFENNNNEAQTRAKLQQQADQVELGRFFQKWGRFLHFTFKSYYYKINAKILGNDLNQNTFYTIQPYFHKVFIEDKSILSSSEEIFNNKHKIANTLLNVSDKDWETYKYMFNYSNSSDVIKHIDECFGDIIITFNLNDINDMYYQTFILNLQDIIHEIDEEGEFEYGPFHISVKQKQDQSNENIVVVNPEIKSEHLYKIF
jgi:GT2 family glycosyltransferase